MTKAETTENRTFSGAYVGLLRAYEEQLNPAHPTETDIEARVIGYGDISAVLMFADASGRVFKRISVFYSDAEINVFSEVINIYCDELRARGIDVVDTECVTVQTEQNGRVLYMVQTAMKPDSIGNAVLREASEDDTRLLIRAILQNIARVFHGNADSELQLGIDGQISNWSWTPNDSGEHYPVYVDVGAPFMHRNGEQLLDWRVLGRSLPQPLRWYFLKFEMEGLLDRFCSINGITIDMAGNFIKEGRKDRIPLLLEEMETWRDGTASDLGIEIPTLQEVEKFYDMDAGIWTYVLAARKIHRFIATHVLRQRYSNILPVKIKRR